MFLVTGTMGFLQTFAPLYATASGLDTAQYGLMSAIATGLAMLIQPILGRGSDRFDARRPFMAGAALLAGCAYLFYRQADGFLAFTFLTAIGVNSFQYLNAAPTVIIGRIAQQEANTSGGATYVRYRVFGSLGYVVVAMGMGWMVNQFISPNQRMTRAGLDPLFLYGPCLFFLIAALCAAIPDLKIKPAVVADDGTRVEKPHRAERMANLNRFLVSSFLYNFALYGASTFLPIYMKSLKATPLQITTMFAGGVVCEIAMMLFAGRWSDKNGRWPILLFAFITMPIRLLLYTAAGNPVQVMLVQLMHGLNFGVVGTIAPVFINDLADDENRGACQAKLAASAGIGLALGPLLCGQIASRFGMPTMFVTMAVFGALGAVWFAVKVRESHPLFARYSA